MPYSLLLVATCRIFYYRLLHAVKFAICCRMLYSLQLRQHATEFAIHCTIPFMQFPICCCMSYSLLLVAASPYSLLFVVASRTAYYLLQHALQYPICYRILYRLLLVVACHAVCHIFYSSLFVAACHTVSYVFVTLLHIWLFISAQSSIMWGKLGTVNCLTTSCTNNSSSLSDKVHRHRKMISATCINH